MDVPTTGVKLWKNSYFVAICSLVILLIFFYVFKIGYTYTKTPEGKVVGTYNWAYPVAIALIIWVIWNFALYPQPEQKMTGGGQRVAEQNLYYLADRVSKRSGGMNIPFSHGVNPQNIDIELIH